MRSSNIKTTLPIVFIILLFLAVPKSILGQPVLKKHQGVRSKPRALIIRGPARDFDNVIAGLTGDIGSEIDFSILSLLNHSNPNLIEAEISQRDPNIIILIGNIPSISYAKLQETRNQKMFPPSIIIAALYIDKYLELKIRNAAGIKHEVPVVTSIVNLRSLLKSDIRKVGVVHREWMNDFIEKSRRDLKREGISLLSYALPNTTTRTIQRVQRAIHSLASKKIDVLWVINDNTLLTEILYRAAWQPTIAEIKIPVVVNVKSFVQPKLKFGAYASVPDYYALGLQAAQLVAEIRDKKWDISQTSSIEPIISVHHIVNINYFQENSIPLDSERLNEVDLVIYPKRLGLTGR